LPTGGPFTHEDEFVGQPPAGAAGVVIGDARWYGQARRERWLRAVAEVATELLAGTDPDAVLQLIAGRVWELTGAGWTLIAVPADPDTAGQVSELTVAVCAGDGGRAGLIRGRRIPVSGSTIGAVFADHVPRKLACTFADQAALAVQRAESLAAQRELRVLADRDRIARDLHEHVIGRLSGIGLTLHGSLHLATSPVVAARIAEHIEHLNDVITEVRAGVVDRPAEPAGTRRLGGLLHDIVGEITADTDLRTSIGITGRIDIVPADLAVHAQAVLREAVSNTVRHAHATELAVTVTVGAELLIDVTDNGVGITVTAARSGLRHLAARATKAGGNCTIDRPGGGGTRLVWTAPLH